MLTQAPNPVYVASASRYEKMPYCRCGKSGLKLPKLSLGLWQNFGAVDNNKTSRDILRTAFDQGITHFDLANNYGPPYGTAESNFGEIYRSDFSVFRDELIISSKAGFDMWPGPYGIGGSRKYLIASCDQSLKRTGLEYFDIFYHHCMDNETPLDETMQALDFIVRSGRALYVGVSNYSAEKTREAAALLNALGTPLIVHQPRYNLFDRWIEDELCSQLKESGMGAISFSPLAQGLLTNKYLKGVPEDSRAANKNIKFLNESDLNSDLLRRVNALNNLALDRGQSLAQMAIAWVLHNSAITSCIIGASRAEQILDSVAALNNLQFNREELDLIDDISRSN